MPLLEHLPPLPGSAGTRRAHLAWAKKWQTRLEPLGRCGPNDQCPACRINQPCPLDMWPAVTAQHAVADSIHGKVFLKTQGKDAGRGVYVTWRNQGLIQVADEALMLCIQHARTNGHPNRAEQMVRAAYDAGSRHPDLIDAYVAQVASTGRYQDLKNALAIAEFGAVDGEGSSHDGWTRLTARIHQLEGRFHRISVRGSGKFDIDGNEIPKRRHHPTNPKRHRAPRFARSW
jgi:hypothetical protein